MQAGIVDQDINSAVVGCDLVDGVFDLLLVGHITDHGLCLAAIGTQFCRCLLTGNRVDIRQYHAGPALCQCLTKGLAKTAATAGDKGHTVGEFCVFSAAHGTFSWPKIAFIVCFTSLLKTNAGQ